MLHTERGCNGNPFESSENDVGNRIFGILSWEVATTADAPFKKFKPYTGTRP